MCPGGGGVKHPLIPPVAALALGILLERYLPLAPRDTLPAIGALLLLGAVALWRGSPRAAGACALTGFVFAGALTAFAHAPAPPPTIDAEARERIKRRNAEFPRLPPR